MFLCFNAFASVHCCLVIVERLFLAEPWGCLRFVIVVFPDHAHLLFLWSPINKIFLVLKNYESKFVPHLPAGSWLAAWIVDLTPDIYLFLFWGSTVAH